MHTQNRIFDLLRGPATSSIAPREILYFCTYRRLHFASVNILVLQILILCPNWPLLCTNQRQKRKVKKFHAPKGVHLWPPLVSWLSLQLEASMVPPWFSSLLQGFSSVWLVLKPLVSQKLLQLLTLACLTVRLYLRWASRYPSAPAHSAVRLLGFLLVLFLTCSAPWSTICFYSE